VPNNLDDPIIETRGLAKHFGDVRAVDGIDLTIGRGEIYEFLGRNGAGKTTTIRMILGKTKPVAAPVWREIATTATILTERLGDDIKAQDQSDEIAERWAIWRAEKASRANDDNGRGVNSAAIFASLS
jgi:ABC-type multidrug transport system ATPase subunit